METIIPEDSTIKYLKKKEIKDIFPLEIEKNQILSEEELINDNNLQNLKLVKNMKGSIKVSAQTSINCICSYKNILLIASNDEIKLYDLANNFEFNGSIKLSEQDKGILCLACSEIDNVLYGAIGGDFPSIHIIDILSFEELTGCQLIGHKNKIYQLEFHPKMPEILLSAGKDCTIRLWNFKSAELLVIFGGPYSFESDVLCMDWNETGDTFVGSGVDCVVRIYKIDELIQNCIDLSMNKKKVKTLLKSLPYFSCNDIHDNLIDCIKYNNRFIISKSVDGIIKEWLPFQDKNGQNSFFLINIFVFNTKQLILGIKFCFVEDNIIVGNEMGQIFLFNKRQTEMNKEVNNHHFFQNNYTQVVNVNDRNEDILLKNINYNSFYNLLFFGGNNGEVYIYKLINDSNK